MRRLKRTVVLDGKNEELLKRLDVEANMNASESVRMALEVLGQIVISGWSGESPEEAVEEILKRHRFTGLIRNLPDTIGYPINPQEPMTFRTSTSKEVRR